MIAHLLFPLLVVAKPAPAPLSPAQAVAQISGEALTDGRAWSKLAELADGIGPRPSGSAGAARAVEWAQAQFRAEKLAVKLEPVKVSHWVRGEERAEIVDNPHFGPQPLALTALGGSSATPAGGLVAEVVEVHALEEIAALGERARGKVIFINHGMSEAADYMKTSALRTHGASAASRVGAAAMLVRSLATASLRSPHTGLTKFDDGVAPIPAAALATEDAERLHRALASGPVKLHLVLTPKILPDADSFNVVAELRGREKPEEIVLLGAHLDAWDLAQGSEDDGAGVATVLETAHLLAQLPVPPRRTVRFVLFMAEENGLYGGKAYAAAHAAELARHVAALESDFGTGRAQGVALKAGTGAAEILAPLLPPLTALGAGTLAAGEAGGSDLGPMAESGVPFVGVRQDGQRYFTVHHSAADTLDKTPPQDLALNAAVFAALTYQLAESQNVLPRTPPPVTAGSH